MDFLNCCCIAIAVAHRPQLARVESGNVSLVGPPPLLAASTLLSTCEARTKRRILKKTKHRVLGSATADKLSAGQMSVRCFYNSSCCLKRWHKSVNAATGAPNQTDSPSFRLLLGG